MLGYDKSNFIPLSGSGLINILLAVVSMIVYNTIRFFCRQLYYFQIFRKIGLQFPRVNHFITLVMFFIKGYFELLFIANISVLSLTPEDFSGNRSDTFSALFGCFSLLVLLVLPVYMFAKIRKHQGNLDKEEIEFKYGLFYADLSTSNFYKSIFHVVFLMRRFVYVITVMFLDEYVGIQLMILSKLSLVYLCYIIHWRPFSEPDLNEGEIFNETCIYLVQLSIMVMHSVTDGKDNVGWMFIGICAFNLTVNMGRIARTLVYEYIPSKY